jgi:2-oxoglutarate/2-oxoacid ferredoxin oxidoreductase subunit alpha
LEIPDTILKYDGRPFFYDELLAQVEERVSAWPDAASTSGNDESSRALRPGGVS